MNRTAYQALVKWRQQKLRLPLLVRGARQVGKSYLIRTLGQH